MYIARFPFSNEINITQNDSSVKALKAAVKNAPDYYDVDVCMSSAVPVKSGHIIFIYIVLYAIDSFSVLNMKKQTLCRFQLDLQLDFLS